MKKYLIDVNLPRYFSLWSGEAYEHVVNINDEMKDSEIWEYAKQHNLVIVTKDADFSDRILLAEPPPRIIHIRTGNMKMRDFHQHLSQLWDQVCLLSDTYKLVQVYNDRIEGVG
ncbi:DUF5615 family PIN-like protein [Candidatus Thiothrix anitrata]|uniref:DUF5615 family PIN-like protein n=1 Tax=Candidatus Thiothrix anitrata TaxID=2823902 RepID=A0ABX7X5Q3_9GAMM|nr:DUF5615 family PIN-like protein [Candidatus Thiothrix anitrata]QTR49938.1 DUF5615 family PIN-like protein [Candidatus Thiothrix anitrata]